MAMIGISKAIVRDSIGTAIYEQVSVLGTGSGSVEIRDRTGMLIAEIPGATVTMLAPDLYQVTAGDGTVYQVERMIGGGCGCGR